MPFIRVEKDGFHYEAEYFFEENTVTIFGERGQSVVDINGVSGEGAARAALRNLIREKNIEPQKSNCGRLSG